MLSDINNFIYILGKSNLHSADIATISKKVMFSDSFVVQVAVQVQYGPVPVSDGYRARNLTELVANHIGNMVKRPIDTKREVSG